MSSGSEGEEEINIGDRGVAERFSELLKVLSNPIRLKILALCLERERSSKELREKLGISKPLLIAHLRKLLNAGFLEYRTELDNARMIVRKYYRTRDLELCIDEDFLRRIAREMNHKRRRKSPT